MGSISNLDDYRRKLSRKHAPAGSWLTDTDILDIDNGLVRDIVAHLLDSLESGPMARCEFERPLFDETGMTWLELAEIIKYEMHRCAGVDPSALLVEAVPANKLSSELIKVTYLLG